MLYALAASDASFAVDLFASRTAAESALLAAVGHEPAFADLLSIVKIAEAEPRIRAG